MSSNATNFSTRLKRKQKEVSDILHHFLNKDSGSFSDLILELEREIIGPNEIKPGNHPECCLMGRRHENNHVIYYFTGVLVSKRIVLTAAHSIVNTKFTYAAALNCSDDMSLGSAEIINSKEIIISPAYDPSTDNNDIAIIVLEKDANTPYVPITQGSELNSSPVVEIVGFGSDDIRGYSGFGKKRSTHINIVSIRKSPTEDLKIAEQTFGHNSNIEFVAGGNGKDTCTGDSGGPAYISVGGKPRVAGLTSRSAKTAVNICGDGGIYTRTDVHKAFIDAAIAKHG